MLVESFNEAFNKKEMSASQRKAIITLIEKKDKDRCFLENWRPISLIHVDSKIASKVISARIIKVLPTIIHFNQTGYVKDRYTGEAAKSILDIMTYTKQTSKSGVLLFIDFEKAFDSIEWNFLLKSLNCFGFGPNLIRWVETFYSGISSCIINNGICSADFNVTRGVRQGDPLSPYLFVLAIELIAIAIRQSKDITGITIGSTEFKLNQYADDLTVTLDNLKSVEALFTLLENFEKCSELKVNQRKTEAMWLGASRNDNASPLGLKWKKCVKALGIYYTYYNKECYKI